MLKSLCFWRITMTIRNAEQKDAVRLYDMLATVQQLHADGRPDIFISGTHKYGLEKIKEILKNPSTPVYVADIDGVAVGYAFCEIKELGSQNLQNIKTSYIDDLCVDEKYRGEGLGKKLYEFVVKKAKETGCHSVTLNVWHLNEKALGFYEYLGMKPLKTTMECKI